MLTNNFLNPFLSRPFLELHNKTNLPFLTVHNRLDSFGTNCLSDKPCIPHLSHISLQQYQIQQQQQQQQQHHHHSPFWFIPPHYRHQPPHFPPIYTADPMLPITRRILSVNPSICSPYLPQAACSSKPSLGVFGRSKSNTSNPSDVDRLHSTHNTKAPIANNSNGSLNQRSLGLDTIGSSSFSYFQGREKSERGRKTFLCPQCHYVTDRKNNLKRHIITMHQECAKVLECCGFVFRSKASLREHVSLFHSTGYGCRICGRNFCRKALLRRHLSVHSGQKDFLCPFCSYATSHKSNLERHQKVHSKKNSNSYDHASIIELSSDLTKTEDERQFKDDSLGSQSFPMTNKNNDNNNNHHENNDNNNNNSNNSNNDNESFLRQPQSVDTKGESEAPSRLRKLFLHDRLNQTYSEVAHELNQGSVSARDFFYQLMNQSKRFKNVASRTLNDEREHNDEEEDGGDDGGDGDNDDDEDRKTIKRKTPRIFMATYKCIDCRNIFSHQSLLNSHTCLKNRHYEDSYLPIIHPLARRQVSTSNRVWHDSDLVCIDPVVKRSKLNVHVESESFERNTTIAATATATRTVATEFGNSAAPGLDVNLISKSDSKISCTTTTTEVESEDKEAKKDFVTDADKTHSNNKTPRLQVEEAGEDEQEEDNSENVIKSEECVSIEYIDIDDSSEADDRDTLEGDGKATAITRRYNETDIHHGQLAEEMNLPPKKRILK